MAGVREKSDGEQEAESTTNKSSKKRDVKVARAIDGELLNLLIGNTQDIFVIVDGRGRQSFVGGAAERITGFTPGELMSMTVFDICHPADRKKAERAFTQCLEHPDRSVTINYRHIKKNGTYVDLEAIGRSFIDHPVLRGVVVTARDNSCHIKIEKELRESEERFHTLSDMSMETLLIHEDAIIIDANRTCEQMFGYTHREIIGKNALDFAIPGSKEVVAANIKKGNEQPYEATGIRKDGSTFPAIIIARKAHYAGREVRVAAIRDIGYRKNMEKVILKSERNFRNLFKQMTSLFSLHEIVVDESDTPIDYRFIEVNPAFEKDMGRNRDTIIGRTYRELTGRPSAFSIEKFGRVALTGAPAHFQQYSEVTGKHYEFIVYRTDERQFAVIATDVTDRIKAMEDLASVYERFMTIFRLSPDAICITRAKDGQLIEVNEMFEKILGMSREEIVGKRWLDLAKLKDRGQGERIESILASESEANNVELDFIMLDGRELSTLTSLKTIDIDGEECRLYILRDNTERKRAELRLAELNTRLEERVSEELAKRHSGEQLLIQQAKMASMGEMIGSISHQWRQPLNTLGLIVQNILEDFDSGPFNRKAIEQIVEDSMDQIRFMSKTIDDFRDFYRPSRLKVSFSAVAAVKDALAIARHRLNVGFIETAIEDRTTAHSIVEGYPNEFKHVVLSLLDNAREAILAARLQQRLDNDDGRITIVISSAPGIVSVAVRDDAGGVPSDIIDKIFEPFFSTKSDGMGTGIGLSMARTIIETNMGGTIAVANVDGGAEFTIELPCV